MISKNYDQNIIKNHQQLYNPIRNSEILQNKKNNFDKFNSTNQKKKQNINSLANFQLSIIKNNPNKIFDQNKKIHNHIRTLMQRNLLMIKKKQQQRLQQLRNTHKITKSKQRIIKNEQIQKNLKQVKNEIVFKQNKISKQRISTSQNQSRFNQFSAIKNIKKINQKLIENSFKQKLNLMSKIKRTQYSQQKKKHKSQKKNIIKKSNTLHFQKQMTPSTLDPVTPKTELNQLQIQYFDDQINEVKQFLVFVQIVFQKFQQIRLQQQESFLTQDISDINKNISDIKFKYHILSQKFKHKQKLYMEQKLRYFQQIRDKLEEIQQNSILKNNKKRTINRITLIDRQISKIYNQKILIQIKKQKQKKNEDQNALDGVQIKKKILIQQSNQNNQVKSRFIDNINQQNNINISMQKNDKSYRKQKNKNILKKHKFRKQQSKKVIINKMQQKLKDKLNQGLVKQNLLKYMINKKDILLIRQEKIINLEQQLLIHPPKIDLQLPQKTQEYKLYLQKRQRNIYNQKLNSCNYYSDQTNINVNIDKKLIQQILKQLNQTQKQSYTNNTNVTDQNQSQQCSERHYKYIPQINMKSKYLKPLYKQYQPTLIVKQEDLIQKSIRNHGKLQQFYILNSHIKLFK